MTLPPDAVPPALSPEEWLDVLDSTDENGAASADVASLAMAGRFHGAGAVALYRQSFGFTHEDVGNLDAALADYRAILSRSSGLHASCAPKILRDLESLSVRIKALLPPPNPDTP